MSDSGGSLLSLPHPAGIGGEFITNLHCPGCGSSFIRPAYRTGGFEKLLYRFHVFPFRCQLCTTRFRAHWPIVLTPPSETDRREYTRLPASFQASILAETTSRLEGRTTELSMGGCTFESSATVPIGTLLKLVIKPASREAPITVETVTICSGREGSMGCRFVSLQPDERHRLSRVVLNLLVGQHIQTSKLLH